VSSRDAVIETLARAFDDGSFLGDLARRVAIRTESQVPGSRSQLDAYLAEEMRPTLERMGYAVEVIENPNPKAGPFLVARRIEDEDALTVLTYGHGDVVRGLEPEWRDGLDPWTLRREGERIYGRGVADNKGQHSINIAALDAVMKARGGRLGFNSIVFLETGEEIGSPGIHEFCERHRGKLRADLLVSSDGPAIDADWGEPGLTSAEKVFAWNTFEILAYRTGNPDNPVNAVPPRATAHCQIRYTVDTDPAGFIPAIRRHLDENGFPNVEVREARGRAAWAATRMDPDHPWVRWAAESVRRTTGQRPAILPNLGGSLPNDAFAHILGLPTIWVPHSYASCSQHAPNEHGLAAILREGLQIMGGIFWDLGENPAPGKPRDFR
jgi:acetylornithine deacetylase/succinyl-diaminopimelate desuccinylase-like protein